MKTLLFVLAATVLLVGCTYKGPSRSFKWKDLECSSTPTEITVESGVLDVIKEQPGGTNDEPEALQQADAPENPVVTYMQACKAFLDGRT